MMNPCKAALVAAVAFGGVAVQSVAASAMPIDTGPAVIARGGEASGIEQAFWRRGWHRHYGWHRHGGWMRPHWGWHRHWHHWR